MKLFSAGFILLSGGIIRGSIKGAYFLNSLFFYGGSYEGGPYSGVYGSIELPPIDALHFG